MKKTSARSRLFAPGRYAALPLVLLERTDLSASAKLVWMALTSHLGPDGTEVWPSIMRLVRMTGLSRPTTLRAIGDLLSLELVAREQTPGKVTRYQMLQPQAGLFKVGSLARPAADRKARPATKRNQYQNDTGVKTTLVKKCAPTGINLIPELLKGTTQEEETPPTPPQAVGVCAVSNQEIAEKLNAAHLAVFGVEMPDCWRRRLAKLNGTATIFAQVTAQDIREVRRRCGHREKDFGFGHLKNFMLEGAASRKGAQEAKIANEKAAQDAAQALRRAMEEQKTRRERREASLAVFDALPAQERGRWLEVVRSRPGGHRISEELARYQAAELVAAGGKRPSAEAAGQRGEVGKTSLAQTAKGEK
jgi:hypothetical protein